MVKRLFFLLAGALLSVLPIERAAAAPQILAVLASEAGVSFICLDGQCEARLTTYCLQQFRDSPGYGTAYTPARAEDFVLAVIDAQGRERLLPAADYVRFTSARGFMSVSAAFPEAALAELGADSAAIRIARAAALLPVPVAGDEDPLTEQEVASATEALRRADRGLVDQNPNAAAAQVLARLSGRLGAMGRYEPRAYAALGRLGAMGSYEPRAYAALWQEVSEEFIGDGPAGPTDPMGRGLPRARERFEECRASWGEAGYAAMGMCLDWRHDELIRDLNIDYWDSQAGS